MRRAQQGDSEAVAALVARHRTSACRVATVVLGSSVDADDVVQTATERALHAIATLDVERPFRPWFLRIVANTARNHRRSRWRRHAAELRLAARPADAEDPAVTVVEAGRRRALVAALNRLSVEDRLVIALRHFEQLTEREMADALDCAPGTVKSRLSRATHRLREELVRGGAEP